MERSDSEATVDCDHGVIFNPMEYELGEGKTLTPNEVRSRWPRLHGVCPKGCGFNGIAYASVQHYLAGDW
jgi:hypothetical protein